MSIRIRGKTGRTVFDEAYNRLYQLYADGHTVVVAFSAGKDSGVCLELAIAAARDAGRLPVHVSMRDEEVMLPGTFEYAERTAARPEVDFRWVVAHQPIVNVFNRAQPYWWTFDKQLQPDQWVRQPPDFATHIDTLDITRIISKTVYPTPEGKDLFAVIGIRASESWVRHYSIFSAEGHLTQPNKLGTRNCRPIYDWQDGDVWRSVRDNGWDYNNAYDTMFRFDIPLRMMRIAPPTLNTASVFLLDMARRAWPRWFDKVETRLPGVKTISQFGMRAVLPHRRHGETWRDTFLRECVEQTPAPWIAERSKRVMDAMVSMHGVHASTDLPEISPCSICHGSLGSWKALCTALYNGDPFALKTKGIGGMLPIEPEFFRKGAGYWGGAPTWA